MEFRTLLSGEIPIHLDQRNRADVSGAASPAGIPPGEFPRKV